jgi:hypothetical protein
MITAEQISDNFKTFQTLVKETFKGDPRLPNIESIVETWEERFTLAPASSKDWYNNAFPGGYLDHVLRVHKIANQQYKLYQYHNCPINYTENELNFVALFCQLGKLGDVVWALPFIKEMGGAETIYFSENGLKDFTIKDIEFIKPLLEFQSYIKDVKIWEQESIDFDLSNFQSLFLGLGVKIQPKNGIINPLFNNLEIKYGYYMRSNGLNAHLVSANIRIK